MVIEGGYNREVQNHEINQAIKEPKEQTNENHKRSASELELNTTIDNYGEQKQLEGKEDSATNDFSQDNGNGLEDVSSIESDNQKSDNSQEVENSQNEAEDLDNQNTIESSKKDTTGIEDIYSDGVHDNLDSIDSLDVAFDKVEEDEGDNEEESASKLYLISDINTENFVNYTLEEDNEQTDNLDNDSRIRSDTDDQTGVDKSEMTEEKAGNNEGLDNKTEDVIAESEGIETGEVKPKLGITSDASNENVDNSNADSEGSKPTDFETKDTNIKKDGSDSSICSFKASGELKDSLKPFEQRNWDSMDIKEQKEAINDLRDKVVDDLELKNKPEVKFYNNNDNTDFGGYSLSENAIYINEHNMGDAAETADTIAHEARHCWQHERAENPLNEQDIEFKENFDDYIRPEDDYRGYKNQPVEVDARDYASSIKDEIKLQNHEVGSEAPAIDEGVQESYSDKIPEKGTVFDTSDTSKSAEIYSKVEIEPISDKALLKCEQAGLDADKVAELREIPNGEKPNPSGYLDKQYIDDHLDKFREYGCYKIISDKRGDPSGTIGEEQGIFVINGQELKNILKYANEDPRKIEEALGIPCNQLGNNPYIIRANNPRNLRMATGNEVNAFQNEWCPCGTTRGGMDEAVIDQLRKGEYSYKHCFDDDEEWKEGKASEGIIRF